ncbi:cuticle protein 19-like [Diabrotica virgifera virgifera]|uniref:Adult-specific cuticular protein ACP-20-like n=1 Tax=Diabrotica virgifera virgifera TaxID=50390 RepID=A0ABM5KAE5_DIAVI|nr:cuticle protein 19-like [Diabrotica virgifera virgifera]
MPDPNENDIHEDLLQVSLLGLVILTVAVVNAGEHVGYKFEYGVHDPHTHDHKTHYEHRDGDHVVGMYTLKEADGTYRIVKYKSGPKSGFEAVVEKVGHAYHPAHHAHS